MDRKIWIILASIAVCLLIVFIVLVIVLPIQRNKDAEDDVKDHSTPKNDNTLLWANFPGELKTQTFHTFNILGYSDDRSTASIKDSIKLSEETKYSNFEFSDLIKFDANSTFKIVSDKASKKNEKIKTLSLGLFETLQTLSNSEKYQQGISSIEYLIRKAFQSPQTFIKHLYSYNLCKTMSKPEMIKTTILKGVAESKHDKILNGDSEYCLNKPLGFDNWVKLLGMESEKLYKVDWLTDLFGLTMREIDSIFGKEEYLYSDCIDFNRKLSTNYNCKDPNACGNEIIYRQLINGKVINGIDKGMKNLTDLYKQININYYPFEKSPELFNFFGQYKEKHKEAEDYNDYELEIEQLERLIDEKSSLSLLSTNNSFFFLSKIDSNNLGVLAERYGMDENTVSFINEYIFEFLPELLLYPSFKNGEETLKVDPMAKAYSNMASDMIKKTYYQLNKLDHLFNRLYAKYVWEELNKELNVEVMQYEEEDICFLIMQQILDDGRKALKICGDPVTSFKSIPDTMKWIDPYRCVVFNETQCNMTVIDRLKEIVYVTENEIKSIYTEHSFGSILESSYKNLYNSLNCGESDKCFDDKYLLKMQWWKSYVSQNLPGDKKSDSLCEIFPEFFSEPVELSYYLKQKQITEEIPEESVDYLISLTPAKSNDYLNEDNYVAFNNRKQFENEFTLYMNDKASGGMKDKIHLFDILNNIFVFDNIVNIEYESVGDFLQGNNKEDKRYLDYLTSGDYYNNYKPGMNKTTGFNFGFNLDTGVNTYAPCDRYAIDKETLRKIVSINNEPYMNIKKVEYDHICNNYIYVEEPILNYEGLTGDKAFIDGFQFNHEDDIIYYFDKISSRPYKFTFSEEIDYEEQTCRKYVLDTKDYKVKTASISQKLNKPIFISVGNEGFDTTITDKISNENYICVEPYSNMVLESKINLVYSLYTKNYGCFYPKIENEKNYPIFTYNREYKVDMDSFEDAFPSLSSAKSFKKYFLIFGIILIVLFAICSGWLIYKACTHKRERISLLPNAPDMNLINDSREATLNKDVENE